MPKISAFPKCQPYIYNLTVVTNKKFRGWIWTCILKPILEFLRQLILGETYLSKRNVLKSVTLDKLLSKWQTHSQSI